MLLPLFPLETREFLPLLETPCSVRCLAPVLSASCSYSAAADRHPGDKSRAQPSCAWSPPSPELGSVPGQAFVQSGENTEAKVSGNRQKHLCSVNQPVHVRRPILGCTHKHTHTHSDKCPPNYLLQEKQILCFGFLKTFSIEDLCHMISINTVRL